MQLTDLVSQPAASITRALNNIYTAAKGIENMAMGYVFSQSVSGIDAATLSMQENIGAISGVESALQSEAEAAYVATSAIISVENAMQKAANSASIAAANTAMYETNLTEMRNALSQVDSALAEALAAQNQFDAAVKSGDPMAYIEAYANPARKSAEEIEKLTAKHDSLNGTIAKTEIIVMKSNAAQSQYHNKGIELAVKHSEKIEDQIQKQEKLNQKVSGTADINKRIEKQAQGMISPFDKWAVRITGVNAALRLTRRIMSAISSGFNAVMGATEKWEGVTNKFNDSITATQKNIGENLLPLAAIGSDLAAQAFDWIGQKANQAISWITDNIGLVTNAIALFGAAGLVVVGIFALANWQTFAVIGGVLLLANALTDFGFTAEDILSFVGGLFGWLYGIVYNVFAAIWNTIAVFIEFFVNVWNDPIGAIGRLFYDLFDSILSIIQTVAGAIGALLGQDWSSGIAGFRQELTALTREVYGESKFKITRMEEKSILETTRAGAQFGTGIGERLTGIESAFQGFDISKYSTSGDGGAALRTKNTEPIKIDGEDIKMLLDISTMKYQVHYQQLTPQIAVNIDTVRESADINQVMEYIADEVGAMAESRLSYGY